LDDFGQKTLARIIIEKWPDGEEGALSRRQYIERVTSSFGNTISKFGSSRSARSQIRTQNLALRGADRCAAVALGVFGERAPRIIVYLIVVVGAKVSVRIICTRCVFGKVRGLERCGGPYLYMTTTTRVYTS